MVYLILGLLMIRSLTIYEIKVTLEQKISPFYAASLGAIQTALKKLLNGELITFESVIENGRKKKIYTITFTGKTAFLQWLRSEIPVNKFNNEALLRVFFLGFLPSEDRAPLIRNYVEKLKIECDEILNYQKNVEMPEFYDQMKVIAEFQLEALDYGIKEVVNEYEWFQSLLERLEKDL